MNYRNKRRFAFIFIILVIILVVMLVSMRQIMYGYIRDTNVKKDAYVYEYNPNTNYGDDD
ncbi:unnamed protein product, partial [marine sediment metagenome]